MAFFRCGQGRRSTRIDDFTLVAESTDSYTATEDGLYLFVYHYLNGSNDSSATDATNINNRWIKVNDVEIPSLFYSATTKIGIGTEGRDNARTFTGYAMQQLTRGDVVTTYSPTMGVIKVQ